MNEKLECSEVCFFFWVQDGITRLIHEFILVLGFQWPRVISSPGTHLHFSLPVILMVKDGGVGVKMTTEVKAFLQIMNSFFIE